MPAESLGQYTAAVASAQSVPNNTVVLAQRGRLCSILVTAAGAGTVTVYDNATTNSGTVVAYINATNANILGYLLACNVPVANGIVVTQASAGVGLTVTYSV